MELAERDIGPAVVKVILERGEPYGAALSEISGKMAGNIKQIGAEIDLFKV